MGALVAIAGIAALIWGAVVLRFGGILAACLGVLLVGCCFGPPFFSYSAGPIPITADRLLLAVIGVLYAAAACQGLVDRKPLGRADVLLGLLLAVLTFSTLRHDWRIDDAQPLSRLVFYFLAPAALYWFSRQAKLGKRQLVMVFGFFSLFGLYFALTAIAEVKQMWPVVFPRYIASPQYEEFFGRGRGPLLNPVGGGLYMIVGLACLSTFWPDGRACRGTSKRRSKQLLLLALGGITMVGIYATLTRSVWLAAALVLVPVVGLRVPRSARLPAVVAGLLVAAPLVALKWEKFQSFKRDQNVSAHEMSQSAGLRPVLAAVAWKMFLDRPLLGCGFGQYKEHDIDYLRDPDSDLPLEKAKPYVQHNVFLGLLTETGLLGLGLFVLLIVYWLRDTWSLWRCEEEESQQFAIVFLSLVMAYLTNAMLHDVTLIPMVNMLLFALAGIGRGLVAAQEERRVPFGRTALGPQLPAVN